MGTTNHATAAPATAASAVTRRLGRTGAVTDGVGKGKGASPEDVVAAAKRRSVRRSLPVLADPEDVDPLLIEEGSSSRRPESPVREKEEEIRGAGRPEGGGRKGVGGGGGGGGGRRGGEEGPAASRVVKHEALPSLHLNARCLKCDRVGTVYCKGCEAHFCTKHDQRRHRFLLRKRHHEHEDLPGISYFRLPMPNALPEGEVPFSDDGTSLSDLSTDTPTRNLQDVVAIQRHTALEAHARMDASGRSTVGVSEAGSPFPTQAPVVGAAAAVIGSEFMARGAEGIRGGAAAGSSARAGDTGGGGGVAPRASTRKKAFKRSNSTMDLARSGWYDKIVMAIVRPPRCKYREEDLGPILTPLSSGLAMRRKDFVVRNRRGLKLVCSQWRPSFAAEDTSQLPCVVYLHGNSSARVDVIKTRSLTILGAAACTVVSFDFSGSGMSEGDWVTLGYFEQHDVADVLAYLRTNGMANKYLLWGRSMGAASALLYAERYPNSDLCGLILDSPFCSFGRLARDLVTEGQIKLPGFLVNGALGMLRHSVKKRTRCDLKTVSPITSASRIQCPSLFIAARKDVMVRPSHGADLSEAVGGASLFVTCRGSHNTSRPGVVLAAVGTFVKGCFRAPDVPISQAFSTIQTKLEEAQASAAAMKANRSASAASTRASRNRLRSNPLSSSAPRPAAMSSRGITEGGELGQTEPRRPLPAASPSGAAARRRRVLSLTRAEDGKRMSSTSSVVSSGKTASLAGESYSSTTSFSRRRSSSFSQVQKGRGSGLSKAAMNGDHVLEVEEVDAEDYVGNTGHVWDAFGTGQIVGNSRSGAVISSGGDRDREGGDGHAPRRGIRQASRPQDYTSTNPTQSLRKSPTWRNTMYDGTKRRTSKSTEGGSTGEMSLDLEPAFRGAMGSTASAMDQDAAPEANDTARAIEGKQQADAVRRGSAASGVSSVGSGIEKAGSHASAERGQGRTGSRGKAAASLFPRYQQDQHREPNRGDAGGTSPALRSATTTTAMATGAAKPTLSSGAPASSGPAATRNASTGEGVHVDGVSSAYRSVGSSLSGLNHCGIQQQQQRNGGVSNHDDGHGERSTEGHLGSARRENSDDAGAHESLMRTGLIRGGAKGVSTNGGASLASGRNGANDVVIGGGADGSVTGSGRVRTRLGRIRLRASGISVLRRGKRGGKSGQRQRQQLQQQLQQQQMQLQQPVTSFAGVASGGRCTACESPPTDCFCNLEGLATSADGDDGGPMRRPSVLRTASGKLKM